MKNPQFEYHPEGSKRARELIQQFHMTLQHAIRNNVKEELTIRAKQEAGILPPLTPGEMFDYLMDTDDEFLNWLFPFCIERLKPSTMGPVHQILVKNIRDSLNNKEKHAEQ